MQDSGHQAERRSASVVDVSSETAEVPLGCTLFLGRSTCQLDGCAQHVEYVWGKTPVVQGVTPISSDFRSFSQSIGSPFLHRWLHRCRSTHLAEMSKCATASLAGFTLALARRWLDTSVVRITGPAAKTGGLHTRLQNNVQQTLMGDRFTGFPEETKTTSEMGTAIFAIVPVLHRGPPGSNSYWPCWQTREPCVWGWRD